MDITNAAAPDSVHQSRSVEQFATCLPLTDSTSRPPRPSRHGRVSASTRYAVQLVVSILHQRGPHNAIVMEPLCSVLGIETRLYLRDNYILLLR